MKRLLVFFLFTYTVCNAQTGIGTTTPNTSAKLEVTASDKGFLPPRVALTASNVFTPITGTAASASGLLIYNTATAGTAPNNVVPGYYYWNGTFWVLIANGLVLDNSKNAGFTLSASDQNKIFLITSASAVTVTVPSTLALGFTCQIIQGGAGAITLTGSGGITLNSSNGFTTRTTNSVIGLLINSSSLGFVFGDSIF